MHTGKLSFVDLQKCLLASSWVTPKEVNLLLRDYVINQGYKQINITNFEEDLYNVRFALTSSRIMDTALPDFEEQLINTCQAAVGKGKFIPIKQLRQILADSKQLCLTAF